MKTSQSEHERICELEATVPGLSDWITELSQKVDSRYSIAPLATSAGLHTGIISYPFPNGLPDILTKLGNFEETAASAGELVSQAEDLADDADLEHEDLVNLKNPTQADLKPSEKKMSRERIKKKAKEVADLIDKTLQKARDAKGKIAGAAAAAKKFKAAKPKIKEAEASFKEAKKLLKQFHKKVGLANKNPLLDELRDLLKDAKNKVSGDIDHLKEALEAIE